MVSQRTRVTIIATMSSIDAPFVGNMIPLKLGREGHMPKDNRTLACVPSLVDTIDDVLYDIPRDTSRTGGAALIHARLSAKLHGLLPGASPQYVITDVHPYDNLTQNFSHEGPIDAKVRA